jgi:molybdopterin converting factor small subunit
VMSVVVELYGMARARAGRSEVAVEARTAREALEGVAAACSGLSGLLAGGRLSPHYLLSLDGERFLAGLDEELPSGARLVLLSADAGG